MAEIRCVTPNTFQITLFAGLDDNPSGGEIKHDLVKLSLPLEHAVLCCLSYPAWVTQGRVGLVMGGPLESVRAVMATSGLSFTKACAVVLQLTLVRARKDDWQCTAHCEHGGSTHVSKSAPYSSPSWSLSLRENLEEEGRR